jgi:hypothetical protein
MKMFLVERDGSVLRLTTVQTPPQLGFYCGTEADIDLLQKALNAEIGRALDKMRRMLKEGPP